MGRNFNSLKHRCQSAKRKQSLIHSEVSLCSDSANRKSACSGSAVSSVRHCEALLLPVLYSSSRSLDHCIWSICQTVISAVLSEPCFWRNTGTFSCLESQLCYTDVAALPLTHSKYSRGWGRSAMNEMCFPLLYYTLPLHCKYHLA